MVAAKDDGIVFYTEGGPGRSPRGPGFFLPSISYFHSSCVVCLEALFAAGVPPEKLHAGLPLLLSPTAALSAQPAVAEPDIKFEGVEVTDGCARLSPPMAKARDIIHFTYLQVLGRVPQQNILDPFFGGLKWFTIGRL